MAHDNPAPPAEVAGIVSIAEQDKTDFVMGCNANTRHIL
jgi:hypothetical protein